jgi:ABC-type Fe3+ transport system substrate-binding protein
MNGKIVIVVLFAAAAGGIFYFTQANRPGAAVGTTPVAAPSDQTEITFLYSTEKKDWVESCATAFKKAEPSIKLTIQGQGSLDAAQAVAEGKATPTLWSPADSSVLALADSDYRTRTNASLWDLGQDAPQPLVLTPLVWVAWDDRAQVLQKSGGGVVNWKAIHKAVASPQGWPAVGGKSDWGFVKLGHTDPTRSNSGLQALLLMTLEFYGKRGGLEVGDVLKPDYQAFVKETEKGVTRFETSTGTFMTEMVLYGPSKYDIAVVYENLAIAQVGNAQGRWGDLHVYYPDLTLWSDHPIALFSSATAKQKDAARKWIAFLRSRPMQEQALRFGFRPSDPSVPLKSADPNNPFNKLAANGIKIDLPPVAETPSGAVVRAILTMWSRTVAK